MKKLNWTGIGLALLAVALVVFGWIFYKSSSTAATSLTTATQGTAGLNSLAGDLDGLLKSSGLVSS